jgi:hypothetical protein
MRGSTEKRHRDPMRTYNNKVRKTTAWYRNMEKNRQEVNALGKPKKALRPLSYFIDRIKKPKTGD